MKKTPQNMKSGFCCMLENMLSEKVDCASTRANQQPRGTIEIVYEAYMFQKYEAGPYVIGHRHHVPIIRFLQY